MSDDLWPEPRGPHLPDTLMRIPLGVWPFLGLAVLAAYGQWEMLRAGPLDNAIDAFWALVRAVAALTVPLLGAALFFRHPTAHRIFPNIAFGVALFAASTVVDALRQPVMDGIGGTDIEYDAWLYAGTGYSLIQALVRVFAITYLAIGLSDARRFEDRAPARVEGIVLVVAALASTGVSAVLGYLSAPDQPGLLAIGTAGQVLTNLAWAYLGWTALRGWAAGEEPSRGWGLVGAAGVAYLAVVVIAAALNVVIWVVSPTEGPVPLVYEVYQLLGVVIAAIWLALLAAFWLGLPAEPDADDADDVALDELPEPA